MYLVAVLVNCLAAKCAIDLAHGFACKAVSAISSLPSIEAVVCRVIEQYSRSAAKTLPIQRSSIASCQPSRKLLYFLCSQKFLWRGFCPCRSQLPSKQPNGYPQGQRDRAPTNGQIDKNNAASWPSLNDSPRLNHSYLTIRQFSKGCNPLNAGISP